MRKLRVILVILIVLLGVAPLSFAQRGFKPRVSQLPAQSVSEVEAQALNAAINDEYRARATYQKVIEKFGEIRPFTNIIKAEERHINSLKALFGKYQITAPEDEWLENVPEFDSVYDACRAGVEGEIENIQLYDKLLTKTTKEDIIRVFRNLRRGSSRHLGAFERCVERYQ